MEDLKIKMVLYTLGIFVFSCALQPSLSNLLPDFSTNFLKVGLIGTVFNLGLGYFLNFIQKQFFDKKHIVESEVLDHEDQSQKRIGDNKLWPFKLGLIFSAVFAIWLMMAVVGAFD